MPLVLDQNGLQEATFEEKLITLQTNLEKIIQGTVDFSSSSPDGNLLRDVVALYIDLQSVLLSIYNSYNPSLAQGNALDNLCVENYIFRNGGSFTLQNIQVVVDRPITLQGLDAAIQDVNGEGFTVSDGGGNEFILASTSNLSIGSNNLVFRAKNLGEVITTSNTITTPITIVAGVVSVNNSTGATEVGKNAELDFDLRVRREKSVARSSVGSVDSAFANLVSMNGFVDAKIYENKTNITDSLGIPAKSVWAIVEGGADSDVAKILNNTISAGCGFKGNISVQVVNQQGSYVVVNFDRPTPQNLYIKFDLKRTTPGFIFNETSIKNYITTNLDYSIGESADSTTVGDIVQKAVLEYGGGGVPLAVKISLDGITWVDYLSPTTADKILTTNSAVITINII